SSREVTWRIHASLYACHHRMVNGCRSQLLRCCRTEARKTAPPERRPSPVRSTMPPRSPGLSRSPLSTLPQRRGDRDNAFEAGRRGAERDTAMGVDDHDLRRQPMAIVTHDQRLLDRADRIVNMVGGRIVSNVRPKELVRILKILQQIKELEGLGDLTLTRIAERMTIKRRRAGDTVVQEGATGDRVYIITEGAAEAYVDGQRVRELTVGQ